jgi:tRNA-specific adenosine deaminase 1
MAGEEIDALLGVQSLGLTTMAAAGLGNVLADVAGVSLATHIEGAVRRIAYFRDAPLSAAQAEMSSVKLARWAGASAGVVVGCLLGLLPLVYMDKFLLAAPGAAGGFEV